MRQETCDMWQVTHDTWHITQNTWHIVWDEHSFKISARWLFRFMINSVWKIFELKDHWINQLMNQWVMEAIVSPASPGLLITLHRIQDKEENITQNTAHYTEYGTLHRINYTTNKTTHCPEYRTLHRINHIGNISLQTAGWRIGCPQTKVRTTMGRNWRYFYFFSSPFHLCHFFISPAGISTLPKRNICSKYCLIYLHCGEGGCF